jgi:hypothetical protein
LYFLGFCLLCLFFPLWKRAHPLPHSTSILTPMQEAQKAVFQRSLVLITKLPTDLIQVSGCNKASWQQGGSQKQPQGTEEGQGSLAHGFSQGKVGKHVISHSGWRGRRRGQGGSTSIALGIPALTSFCTLMPPWKDWGWC